MVPSNAREWRRSHHPSSLGNGYHGIGSGNIRIGALEGYTYRLVHSRQLHVAASILEPRHADHFWLV